MNCFFGILVFMNDDKLKLNMLRGWFDIEFCNYLIIDIVGIIFFINRSCFVKKKKNYY